MMLVCCLLSTNTQLRGDSNDYLGYRTTTRSGYTCQAWAARNPQSHSNQFISITKHPEETMCHWEHKKAKVEASVRLRYLAPPLLICNSTVFTFYMHAFGQVKFLLLTSAGPKEVAAATIFNIIIVATITQVSIAAVQT